MLKSYRLCSSARQKPTDVHIVHSDGCSELEKVQELEFIGLCSSSKAAISEAQRRGYQEVKACRMCSHNWEPIDYSAI